MENLIFNELRHSQMHLFHFRTQPLTIKATAPILETFKVEKSKYYLILYARFWINVL
jgi:hypothetical protein